MQQSVKSTNLKQILTTDLKLKIQEGFESKTKT